MECIREIGSPVWAVLLRNRPNAASFAVLCELCEKESARKKRGTLAQSSQRTAKQAIYYLAFRDDESLHALFEEWGYIESEVAV